MIQQQLHAALIGHGRMGRAIERLAPQRDVNVAVCYDAASPPRGERPDAEFDVAIEFTSPDAAVANIRTILEWNRPIVVGTTGWHERLDEVHGLVERHGGRMVYASNFSVGVAVFMKIVAEAARLVDATELYDVALHEIHHTGKADSPSGTALRLAELVLQGSRRKTELLSETSHSAIDAARLHVSSQRLGATPGTHTVSFDSEVDTIELTHRARSRDGFALGALVAARWIVEQPPGLYRFEDIWI